VTYVTRARETPWSLWLASIGILGALFIPIQTDAPTRPYVGAIVVICLVLLALVAMGSRVAWGSAVLMMVAGVIGTALNGTWLDVALRAVVLVLLLLPSSRHFVWRRRLA
jgi:hypothetical protein